MDRNLYINKELYLELPITEVDCSNGFYNKLSEIMTPDSLFVIHTDGKCIYLEDDDPGRVLAKESSISEGSDYNKLLEELGWVIDDEDDIYENNVTKGVERGKNEIYASMEFIPYTHLCYDYAMGEVYIEGVEYDYGIPETEKEYKLTRGNILNESGFLGFRCKRRRVKKRLWTALNGWEVSGIEVTRLERVRGVVVVLERFYLTNLNLLRSGEATREELGRKYLSCGELTHRDFTTGGINKENYNYGYKYLSNKHKHLINLWGTEWDCGGDNFSNNCNRYLNLDEVCKCLGYSGRCLTDRINYCERVLNIGEKSEIERVHDFSSAFLNHMLSDEFRYNMGRVFSGNNYWFTKYRLGDVEIIIRRQWLTNYKNH